LSRHERFSPKQSKANAAVVCEIIAGEMWKWWERERERESERESMCVCVCGWGRRTLNCTPTGCAWQALLLQQSMCVQCLLLLLQSCESQLLLLLLSLCLCLSHRRNDTSHAAAFVSVDVDSSCDEREEIYIDRQIQFLQ
jgi:hypothetical protein